MRSLPRVTQPDPPAALIGRDAEFALLNDRLASGRPVVVAGEAGIGKTTLVRAAARTTGRPVFEGGGLSMLGWMPYLAITRALGRVPPVGDVGTVAEFVIGEVGVGTLILDDLQWVDTGSLALLQYLVDAISVVATLRRDDPGAAKVLTRVRRARFEVLDLAGLGDPAARDLLAVARPELDGSAATSLIGQARGNPLLLQELTMAPSTDRSPSFDAGLTARLGRHSRRAQHSAAKLAILGRPGTRADLGPGVQELIDAGLAVETDQGVVLRHALLGEAALELLGPAACTRLHAGLARTLVDPGERALHHAAAGEPRLAFRRATEALRHAKLPGERAHHLAIAAACAPADRGPELRLQAAAALLEAGQPDDALELVASLEGGSDTVRAERLLLCARSRWAIGDVVAAKRDAEQGLVMVEGRGTALEVALLLELSRQSAWGWDAREARRFSRRALDIPACRGRDRLEAEHRQASGDYVSYSRRCLVTLRQSIAAARAADDLELECDAAVMLAGGLEGFREPRAALELAEEMLHRTASRGRLSLQAVFRMSCAHLAFFYGADHAALETHAQWLAERPRLLAKGTQAAQVLRVLAAADRGRFTEGRALGEALARETEQGTEEHVSALYALADLEWAAGRARRAVAVADEALQVVTGFDIAVGFEVIRAWAAYEASAPQTPPRGRAAFPCMRGAVTETRAVQALARGDCAESARLFRLAARQWDGIEPRCRARCLWGAGEAARQGADLGRARRALLAAEAYAEQYEFVAVLNRVRRSLRKVGMQRSASRAPVDDVLSVREREVMTLVAGGFRSYEIAAALGIARSTVESHVRSSVTKLNATNRRDAAVRAVRDGARNAGSRVPLTIAADAGSAARIARDTASAKGWTVHDGWVIPRARWQLDGVPVVCVGEVADRADAAAALVAAARGAGVVAWLRADTTVAGTFSEDLARLGTVDWHAHAKPGLEALADDQRLLLEMLADGASVRAAAGHLHYSLRTAHRRLGAAREALGVRSTAEALAKFSQSRAGGLSAVAPE